MSFPGIFISIEGIEGAGKTTAISFIQNFLTRQQKNFILTREPGGTVVAEQIRQILLIPQQKEIITSETELLLMFACRAQHLAEVILPALRRGDWVVSDRYVDASYAYQGGGRQMNRVQIEMLDHWVVKNVYPDLTILLDVPAELGLERAKKRGAQDRIEQEKIEFFSRVREVYLARAKQFPERFRVIDASQNLKTVEAELETYLNELFHKV